jgi:hypothetical protein
MVSKGVLAGEFSNLTTPLIADACLRVRVLLRVAPAVNNLKEGPAAVPIG